MDDGMKTMVGGTILGLTMVLVVGAAGSEIMKNRMIKKIGTSNRFRKAYKNEYEFAKATIAASYFPTEEE